jgi:hypothetical protein
MCSTSQKYLTTSLKITKRLKIKKNSKNIYAGRRRVRRAREENSRAKRTREKEERREVSSSKKSKAGSLSCEKKNSKKVEEEGKRCRFFLSLSRFLCR